MWKIAYDSLLLNFYINILPTNLKLKAQKCEANHCNIFGVYVVSISVNC